MGNALNIMRWEWFKLVRRRMPWILLGILFAFTQLTIWGNYFSYSKAVAMGGRMIAPRTNGSMPLMVRCSDLRSNPPAGITPQAAQTLLVACQLRVSAQYQTLSPSRGTTSALAIATSLGVVLLGILSAAVFGIEYGLGTLRPILARGTGRLAFLTGKYLALVAAATAALLLVTVAATGSGMLAFHGAAMPPTGAVTVTGVSFHDVALSFARSLAALIAFVTMASSITVLTRSTAAGMALSLGYSVFEPIFIRLMSAAFDWFDTVGNYLPMRNISALGRASTNLNVAAAGAAGNDVGTLHASIVVAVYVVVFAGLALAVFRRRDITGASAG